MLACSNINLVIKKMKLGVTGFIRNHGGNSQLLNIIEQKFSLTNSILKNIKTVKYKTKTTIK